MAVLPTWRILVPPFHFTEECSGHCYTSLWPPGPLKPPSLRPIQHMSHKVVTWQKQRELFYSDAASSQSAVKGCKCPSAPLRVFVWMTNTAHRAHSLSPRAYKQGYYEPPVCLKRCILQQKAHSYPPRKDHWKDHISHISHAGPHPAACVL